MDNYICIDGMKVLLIESQISELRAILEKRESIDKELLKQRALEEILARRLWRYSMEHGGDKIDWSDCECKYTIYYDIEDGLFYTSCNTTCQTTNTIYFVDRKTALNAIKEVIKPFMEEYPDFKSYRTRPARLERRIIC